MGPGARRGLLKTLEAWCKACSLSPGRARDLRTSPLVQRGDADVVFLSVETYEEDSHNVSAVADGYRSLAAAHPNIAVEVPGGSQKSTTTFLLDELKRRDRLHGA